MFIFFLSFTQSTINGWAHAEMFDDTHILSDHLLIYDVVLQDAC